MSLFIIPTSVANRIKKLQRDFLWGGMGEKTQVALGEVENSLYSYDKWLFGYKEDHFFQQNLVG